jgi:hypothetical protein
MTDIKTITRLAPRQTRAAGSGEKSLLDNSGNCYLRAKGALTHAGQTTALKLFDMGTPPGPTNKFKCLGEKQVKKVI